MKPTTRPADMRPEVLHEKLRGHYQLARALECNTANRPLRTHYVTRLANAMERGEWQCNGDAIRVSRAGVLLDGPHRCAAVVQSGVTVATLLVLGLEDDVFGTIDRGLGRTTRDVFSIRGEANATNLAASTRLLYIYLHAGQPFNSNPDHVPTSQQQVELLNEHPEIHASARWSGSARWCRKFLSPALTTFCHVVFSDKNFDAAAVFFDQLESGAGLESSSPILLLRNRLMNEHKSRQTELEREFKAALVFRAFSLHLADAQVKTLRVPVDKSGRIDTAVFVL